MYKVQCVDYDGNSKVLEFDNKQDAQDSYYRKYNNSMLYLFLALYEDDTVKVFHSSQINMPNMESED